MTTKFDIFSNSKIAPFCLTKVSNSQAISIFARIFQGAFYLWSFISTSYFTCRLLWNSVFVQEGSGKFWKMASLTRICLRSAITHGSKAQLVRNVSVSAVAQKDYSKFQTFFNRDFQTDLMTDFDFVKRSKYLPMDLLYSSTCEGHIISVYLKNK